MSRWEQCVTLKGAGDNIIVVESSRLLR